MDGEDSSDLSEKPLPAAVVDDADIRRRARVVDMMLSMHSTLRDRYARWAAILDLVIFAGSLVLLATVLLDPRVLGFLRISDDGARVTMGLVSTLIFFLSIVALRVDWKE